MTLAYFYRCFLTSGFGRFFGAKQPRLCNGLGLCQTTHFICLAGGAAGVPTFRLNPGRGSRGRSCSRSTPGPSCGGVSYEPVRGSLGASHRGCLSGISHRPDARRSSSSLPADVEAAIGTDCRATPAAGRADGVRRPQSNWKLTPEDAERIREARLFGARNCDLARAYGVGQSTVATVARGLSFAPPPSPTFCLLQRFCLQAVL